MLTINTNQAALFTSRMLSGGQPKLADSMRKLSSGLRINSAKDDASGLAITDRMTAQIRGLNQATRNINDGISLLQTAEGAMQEVTNILQRGRELSIQAGSAALSDSDLQSIQAEINQIKQEVNRIGDTTSFNGQFILRENQGSSGQSTTQSKIDVENGLRSGWLENSEQMIIDGFGLTGVGSDLEINYVDDSGDGRVAWVTSLLSGATQEAVSQELTIDLSDFIPVDSEDGGTAPYYNDRIIAHEMVHAVMGVSTNYGLLETWFKEGAAEIIQGADERLFGALEYRINTLGESVDDAVNHMVSTIGVAWNDGSDPVLLNEQYASAYAATRFLHDAIKEAGGTGIDELMGLLSSNKENNSYDLSAALADITTAHSSFAYSSTTDFINGFTAANGDGFDYMKEMYTSGDLANDDTGALGGLDADNGPILTAKSVVPNGAAYTSDPLIGFNEIWEDAGSIGQPATRLALQVGANANQMLTVSTLAISSNSLNIDDVDLAGGSYNLAIIKFDQAINVIDEHRGELGAQMNRLEHAMMVNSNTAENLSTARSRILDVDVAQETSELTRQNIIQQAAISMLSQAGIAPQLALQLLG